MTDRDCTTCGTVGCGHQDAMRCGVMLADWTPREKVKLTGAMLAKAIRMLEAHDAIPSHIDVTREQFENMLADIGQGCRAEPGTVNRFMGVELRIKEKV